MSDEPGVLVGASVDELDDEFDGAVSDFSVDADLGREAVRAHAARAGRRARGAGGSSGCGRLATVTTTSVASQTAAAPGPLRVSRAPGVLDPGARLGTHGEGPGPVPVWADPDADGARIEPFGSVAELAGEDVVLAGETSEPEGRGRVDVESLEVVASAFEGDLSVEPGYEAVAGLGGALGGHE